MVVRSMLTSWRDCVRRGRWRPFLWTRINGLSMYSLTLVLKMLQNLSSASFLNPQTLSPDRVALFNLSNFTHAFLFKVHLPTLPSTRPSWSLMEGSWDWTFQTEVTSHTASWRRRRRSQQRPSSLSPCHIRYGIVPSTSTHTLIQTSWLRISWVTIQYE